MDRRWFLIMIAAVQLIVRTTWVESSILVARAQDQSKRLVRVENVSMSPAVIHSNRENGPTCGAATVRVAVVGSGRPGQSNPKVKVVMEEASSQPPGVQVGISNVNPPDDVKTLTASQGSFTFQVCATGSATGKVKVQADIWYVKPASGYDREEPRLPISGRAEFTVLP